MREFLQVVGICLHGNSCAWMPSEQRPPELLGWTDLFSNTYEIEFLRPRLKAGGSTGTVALGTSRWYKRMQSEGVSTYFLVGIPKWGSSSYPEDLGIFTDGNTGAEFWRFHKRTRISGSRDSSPYKLFFTSERATRNLSSVPESGLVSTSSILKLVFRIASLLRSEGSTFARNFERVADLAISHNPQAEFADFIGSQFSGQDRLVLIVCMESLKTLRSVCSDKKLSSDALECCRQLWDDCLTCITTAVNVGHLQAEEAA